MNLKDQEARWTIEREHRRNLFVEAGAGTGKTTSLVRRIANLTTGGSAVPMRTIAAITFTEKAAGELSERLRKELEQRAKEHPEDATIVVALQEIGSAALCTIHSFAHSILSRFPLEAGLPPGFTNLDDVDSAIRFEEWWADLLEDLLESVDEAVWEEALELDVHPGRLKQFAKALQGLGDRVPTTEFAPMDVPVEGLREDVHQLAEAFEALREHQAACFTPDLLYQKISEAGGWLGELESAIASRDAIASDLCAILRRCPKRFGNAGSKACWPVDPASIRHDGEPFFKAAEGMRKRIQAAENCAKVAPLLNRIRQAVLEDADRRRKEGRVDFDDLLTLCARLLRNNEGVRDELSREYSAILVDESQDTDPLQVEIVFLLCHGREGIPGGKVFFVGDPKQSIYRFRRADVRVYEQAKARVTNSRIPLVANFRSSTEILDFVNSTFQALFGANDMQAAYEPLAPSGLTPHCDPCVVHMVGGTDASEASIGKLRTAEAEDMATILRCAVHGGVWPNCESRSPWHVRVGRSSEFREATFQDATVLIRSRTSLPHIEVALESAGIPYRIDSRSLLFASQEIRDLLSILRSIDDPTDEVALVAALRSPAFACTDADLFRHRRSGWDYRKSRTETESTPVTDAMAELHRYHLDRHGVDVATLLDRIVRERRILELLIVKKRPRDHWRRVLMLLDLARAYDASSGGTLRGFLQRMDTLEENDARLSESVVPEADDNAVCLTTIHAAKGLEFPIVLLVGLGSHHERKESVTIGCDDTGQVHFRMATSVETLGAHRLISDEKAMRRLEDDRLLYVAATRAMDHLVVSGYHDSSHGNDSPGGRMFGCMQERYRTAWPLDPSEPPATPLTTGAGPCDRQGWIERRERELKAAMPPVTRAPTTLAKEVTEWVRNDRCLPMRRRTRPNTSQPHGGADLGRAVHMTMQMIDLSVEDVEAHRDTVAAQATAEDRDPAEVRPLIQRALKTRPVREAVDGEFWREIFLSAFVEGILIEGYMDLLYRRDGRYVVVDYKTDQVSGSEIAERMKMYRYQAAAYALAMEQTLGHRPSSVSFVFLNPDPAVVADVSDLDEAMETVREYLHWLNGVPVEAVAFEEDAEDWHAVEEGTLLL